MKSTTYKTKILTMPSENEFVYLDAQTEVRLLKIPTVTRYWFKLTEIFKTENITSELSTA